MIPGMTPARVVIVGRTHMGVGVCVGGMVEGTGKPVRLLPIDGTCHKPSIPFRVGEVWDMRIRPRMNPEPPHTEDHDECQAKKVGDVPDLAAYVRRHARVHEGEPHGLFGRLLHFRPTGTAYLPKVEVRPTWSVQFWTLPRPLRDESSDSKHRYVMEGATRFRVPHVGFGTPVGEIPAGTLVRVSLARWWLNPHLPEEGETCGLQLSGWIKDAPA